MPYEVEPQELFCSELENSLDFQWVRSDASVMATIEKRVNQDGSVAFRAKVRLRGSPKQSATFTKLSDARNWAIQTESAIQQGVHFKNEEARRHTLGELITRYQQTILSRKSENYKFVQCQHKQLDWWKEHLGEYWLSEITAARIIEVRSKLQVSSSTINRYMAALSHVFSIAVREWEWMETSPISKISKLKEPRGRVRYLSDEERERLFSAVKSAGDLTLEVLVTLAISTGARKGELLNLDWMDVDLQRRRLIFQKTKNGQKRAAALGEHAYQLLRRYADSKKPQSGLVFPSNKDKPVRIDREFKQLLELADIKDFRFHDLRHCAASYLAMSGATLTDIAYILGHKTLSMVQRYTHLSDTHTSQVVSRMNAQIFK